MKVPSSIHEALFVKLREADKIDWSRAVVDSASVRAVGGAQTGPTGSTNSVWLRVRFEQRADTREAFLSLGCALICWDYLGSP